MPMFIHFLFRADEDIQTKYQTYIRREKERERERESAYTTREVRRSNQ